MFRVLSYLKFIGASTNHHGVHSPFVYKFVTQCLYDKSKYEAYSNIAKYRNSLLNDALEIEIEDFGAGSTIFKSNKRSIKAIAHHAGSSFKRAKLLFRLCHYFKVKSILELGTSLGIASFAMSNAKSITDITTIEGCPELANYSEQRLKEFNCQNIKVINGNFKTTLPKLKQSSFDLVYFDGHHSKSATLSNFEVLLEKIHNDSLFVFDDIYWSKGMSEAWNVIKAHPMVKITLDCYHLGFVFFRTEQCKQHFKIRL